MSGDSRPPALLVEVVSDFVCPWCFIGKRNLEVALRDLGLPVAVRWLPYFLNPDTPPPGEPYRPFLEKKFGGPDAVEALWARVREAGVAAGIKFAFEQIELRASTLAAHRLIRRVQARGGDAAPLVERIFVAGFCEGRRIGDPEVLAELSGAVGEERAALADWLAGDEGAAEVRDQENAIRRLGAGGVPLFIVSRQYAISGAQPPAVMLETLRRAAGAAGCR